MARLAGLFLLMLLSVPALAQVENNKVDVSGGYSLSRNEGITVNGWYGDVGFRVYRSLYAVGTSTGAYYSDSLMVSGTTYSLRASTHFFGGGPRVFIRKHDVVSPFVDTLVGGFHASTSLVEGFVPSGDAFTASGISLSIGGGSDFKISKLLSLRLRPAYILARVEGDFDSSFEFNAGLVLHFKH